MEGTASAGDCDDDAGRKRKPSSPPDHQRESKQCTGSSSGTKTGDHRRKQSLNDALQFLLTLKKNIDSDTYNKFLQTMLELNSTRNTAKCVKTVKELLKDHPDLYLGFKNFLPPGWNAPKISSPEEHPAYNDALSLVLKIKNCIPDNDNETFLETLRMFRFNQISKEEVYDKFVVLFKDNNDLFEQLKHFISPSDHVSENLDPAEVPSVVGEKLDSPKVTEGREGTEGKKEKID